MADVEAPAAAAPPAAEEEEKKPEEPEPEPQPADEDVFPVDAAVYNVPQWAKENEASFQPPICNKLMYEGQLKVMFIGGPNTRKDFHIDCGEEFFYQMKGDMMLPIYEQGKRRVVTIKEGEVFLLPGRIPHSPQRPSKGSLGLVVERHRIKPELDALRFYRAADTTQVLWEKWFYCTDLGTQLKPIVDEFKSSEECATDAPSETSVYKPPPIALDETTVVPDPFPLAKWLEEKDEELRREKQLPLFPPIGEEPQTSVRVMAGPFRYEQTFPLETWLYVLKCGDEEKGVTVSFTRDGDEREAKSLKAEECLLVGSDQPFRVVIPGENDRLLVVNMLPPKNVFQDPRASKKAPGTRSNSVSDYEEDDDSM